MWTLLNRPIGFVRLVWIDVYNLSRSASAITGWSVMITNPSLFDSAITTFKLYVQNSNPFPLNICVIGEQLCSYIWLCLKIHLKSLLLHFSAVNWLLCHFFWFKRQIRILRPMINAPSPGQEFFVEDVLTNFRALCIISIMLDFFYPSIAYNFVWSGIVSHSPTSW